MKKIHFIATFIFYIGSFIFAAMEGDFFISLFLVISVLFFFGYALYLLINCIQLKQYPNMLFLFPLSLLIFYIIIFQTSSYLSKQIDLQAQQAAPMLLAQCEKEQNSCSTMKKITFKQLYFTKDFFYRLDQGCLKVTSVNYSLFKKHFNYCKPLPH